MTGIKSNIDRRAQSRHEAEQDLIWADERRRHELGECPGSPECSICLDEEEIKNQPNEGEEYGS